MNTLSIFYCPFLTYILHSLRNRQHTPQNYKNHKTFYAFDIQQNKSSIQVISKYQVVSPQMEYSYHLHNVSENYEQLMLISH